MASRLAGLILQPPVTNLEAPLSHHCPAIVLPPSYYCSTTQDENPANMKGGHGELISVLDHMTLEGSVVTSVKSAGKAGVGGGNDYRLLPVMHLCVRCSCSMVHACTCQLYSHLVSSPLVSSPLSYREGPDGTTSDTRAGSLLR